MRSGQAHSSQKMNFSAVKFTCFWVPKAYSSILNVGGKEREEGTEALLLQYFTTLYQYTRFSESKSNNKGRAVTHSALSCSKGHFPHLYACLQPGQLLFLSQSAQDGR